MKDYPAIGKVLQYPGSARAFRGCPFCQIVGESCNCNKTLFLQNRRYLPLQHVLRHQTKGQVNNAEETRDPPAVHYDDECTRWLRQKYDKLPNQNQKKKFTDSHGIKGSYIFMDLSYHTSHQFGYDMMHTLKNACANILMRQGFEWVRIGGKGP